METSSPVVGCEGEIALAGSSGIKAFNPDGTARWRVECGGGQSTPAFTKDGVLWAIVRGLEGGVGVGSPDAPGALVGISNNGRISKIAVEDNDLWTDGSLLVDADGQIFFHAENYGLVGVNSAGEVVVPREHFTNHVAERSSLVQAANGYFFFNEQEAAFRCLSRDRSHVFNYYASYALSGGVNNGAWLEAGPHIAGGTTLIFSSPGFPVNAVDIDFLIDYVKRHPPRPAYQSVPCPEALRWQIRGDSTEQGTGAAEGPGGRIYAGTNSNRFFCLDRAGKVIWQRDLGTPPSYPIVDADGIIYLACQSGLVLALSPDGYPLWHCALEARVPALSPALGDKVLYVVDAMGRLHAIGETPEVSSRSATPGWGVPEKAFDAALAAQDWESAAKLCEQINVRSEHPMGRGGPLNLCLDYEAPVEIAERLLRSGADANRRCVNGEAPLHVAVAKGLNSYVEALCKHGAGINAPGLNGHAPLEAAFFAGNLDAADVLLRHGADTSDQPNTWTYLWLAARAGSVRHVRYFLDLGRPVDQQDRMKRTPLSIAAICGHLDVVRLLIEAGAEVDGISPGGDSPLMWAVYHGHIQVAEYLLDKGANVNYRSPRGATAYSLAIMRSHLDILAMLKARGAVPDDPRAKQGMDPGQQFGQYISSISEILADGIKEQLANLGLLGWPGSGGEQDERTEPERILDTAVMNRRFEVIERLADEGTDPTLIFQRCNGIALNFFMEVSVDLMRKLLDLGADVNARNPDTDCTALITAASIGRVDLVRLFLERGADVNVVAREPPMTGRRALIDAVLSDHLEVAKLLVEAGADTNVCDYLGRSLIAIAEARENDAMVAYLQTVI